MKINVHLFLTSAFAAILAASPASAEETQTGSPLVQRQSVAEATPAPERATPAPIANDASWQEDDASDDGGADARRWPDEDDEPEDR